MVLETGLPCVVRDRVTVGRLRVARRSQARSLPEPFDDGEIEFVEMLQNVAIDALSHGVSDAISDRQISKGR